jgi:hypothetical protein
VCEKRAKVSSDGSARTRILPLSSHNLGQATEVGHQVSFIERRVPKEGYTRAKHVRFLCKFRNGQENWAQADAEMPQDPIPTIQYIEREGLVAKANFVWAQSFLKDGERLAKMVNAFKAKVDRSPKFKFGIQVPRNLQHTM